MKDAKEAVPANAARQSAGVVPARRRGFAAGLFLRFVISAAVSAAAGFAAFWFFVRTPRDAETPTIRVQSRSMEPIFTGPGFVSVCPSCACSFVTSVDVQTVPPAIDGPRRGETPPGNENSPEAQAFRERARVVTCPSCGTGVSASSAVFRDGDAVTIGECRDPSSARNQPFVFRARNGSMTLKRLIGLPGERIEIRNGDVLIDGAADWRSPAEVWSTASEILQTREFRLPDRVYLTHVTTTRTTTVADGRSQTLVEKVPTGISNESPVPCFNGGNASAPEPVRDFLLLYTWTPPEPGATGERAILTLVQRPGYAYLLRYDPASRVGSARRLQLPAARVGKGDAFASTPASAFDGLPDLPSETLAPASSPAVSGASASFRGPVAVGVVSADGWITLEIDGEDVFRVATSDADEPALQAISTPFAALSPPERTSGLRVFRDVHYGSPPDGVSERALGAGEYFMLGDNSPASVDSRFAEFGTADLREGYLARQRRWNDGRPERQGRSPGWRQGY